MRFPASRASFRIRYSPFDVVWAALSPPIALYLRTINIDSSSGLAAAEWFCVIAFISSLVAFVLFRIREGIAHHFSVRDALEVAKAVVVSELLTTLTLFTAVRLEGIPRSTPIIHALILGAGLIVYRVIIRMRHDDLPQSFEPSQAAAENVILIGCTRLSLLYMRMLKAYSPKRCKVVAIVDDDPKNFGRSLDGVHVVGAPKQIETTIQEFAEHGIIINRILVGGDKDLLTPEDVDAIGRASAGRSLTLQYIPSLAGLESSEQAAVASPKVTKNNPTPSVQLPLYFRFKRVADIVVGLIALVLMLPIILIVACIVLFDVGSPILFWQQRMGVGGRPFLMHKFRTLKPLFNDRGLPIGTSDRMSWAGAFIRNARLDELPQLLNVLVGDMSLVGPRPLLPQDQPPNPAIRLMVKPGLTGWAQVNGGKSLNAEQKNQYDEWYVRNASLWLDLRILWMTLGLVFKGDVPVPASLIDTRETADNQCNP